VDALYADREHLSSAKRAADIWSASFTRDPSDFDSAWKLARICYWLGGHGADKERRAFLEQGIKAAQAAQLLQPNRPEGHFWTAANMGELAEHFGLRAGLRYRGPIRTELEAVRRIDASYMAGSADRALGRYYHKVPSLFGGSLSGAEQHLRASLVYDETNTISRYFLAEVLIDAKRVPEARIELQRVLDAPLHPEWTPEDKEFKQKAASLLATLH
jgi:hypothetical protein